MKSIGIKLILAFCLGAALMWYIGVGKRDASPPDHRPTNPPVAAEPAVKNGDSKTNTTAVKVTTATVTNAIPPSSISSNAPPSAAAGTNTVATTGEPEKKPDEVADVQVTFKMAQIDQIIEWLAKQTGKSVIKHPTARSQLTIVSSKKVTQREAINLVYRALGVEGFSAIEDDQSILIVPAGKEPKLSPTIIGADQDTIPDGRQQIVKILELKHANAAEIKDRCRSVLSETAQVEADPRGNKLIVTDYTENIRLLIELLPSFDRETEGDSIVHIFPLKHLEADEVSQLLGLILNQDKSTSPSSSSSSSRSSRSYSSSSSSRSRSPSNSSGPASASASVGEDLKFWPDRSSNRLIASLPKARLKEITELIEMLDTEKPQDVGVRVLTLEHVDASELVDEIAPLYRKLGGQSLKETVEITANERSNSLIILSSESNYENIEKFIRQLDTEDAAEQIMETIPLTNADSEEVALQLKELTDGNKTTSRYTYYFSSPSKSSKKMNIVSDRRRNSVIVQASPAELISVKKMIQVLDEPVGEDALAPKIFQLQYVSAVDIEDVLNELFLKKEKQRSYWDYFDGGSSSSDSPMNVGRLNGKVRITSEPFSNSLIIAANSVESMEAVEAVIRQLDIASPAGESTMRHPLKFANAIEVANSLNVLFAQDGAPTLRPQNQPQNQQNNTPRVTQPNQTAPRTDSFALERENDVETYFPWLGGQQGGNRTRDGKVQRPASEMVGRVRVVPDKRSNSLLLTTDLHYFPQVIKLVNELDAPTAQILIEAKIVEVSSDFRDRLGTRWSPDGTRTFDNEDIDGAFSPKVGANFMNLLLGSLGTNAFRSGVLNSSINVDMLVQFLRKNTDATVLAEPKISVSDNELGKLFVGSQVPFISGSLNTDFGGRNDSFQYKDVGIILEVTPQINNAEEIALSIRVESSSIRDGQTLFGGAIIDTRNFRTDLMVKTGETIVLGGIIQKEEGEVIRKVPFFGDIPGLGWAFKKKDKTTRSVELMVFLRPVISRSPEEAKALVEQIQNRMPVLQRWQREEEALIKDGTNAPPGRIPN
jgi:general secretion pathway protein D